MRKSHILLVLALSAIFMLPARADEIEELKAAMESMKQTMAEMQKKISTLEQENRAAKRQASAVRTTTTTPAGAIPPAEGPRRTTTTTTTSEVNAYGDQVVTIAPTAVTVQSRASQVRQRPAVRDEQEAAPRPGDLTLDPKYRGFFPIPNTPVLIKLNAKPRVDITGDPHNVGNEDRFVTATIPVEGDPFKGGGHMFNINARGSQLSADVRAPSLDGSPRFYFQNDFFGSGPNEYNFRVRQLYGSIYNLIIGQTFSVFEDPDAWPDTVDYEGPNSAIFARRPLVRYQIPFNDHWQLNLGVEQPGSEVDTSIDPDAVSIDHAPDAGFNVRWENSNIGHVQLGAIFRDIAVEGPLVGEQSTFGWGLNLSTALNFGENDSFQAQLTYGEGLFRYFNDDFVNNDAAFSDSGELCAIPAFGAMVGYTHKWSPWVRSTASYGYVKLDPLPSQGPDAYESTHYASLNVVWQARKRLTVGFEGLYGRKEVQSGADGDAFRFQLGIVYSIFD